MKAFLMHVDRDFVVAPALRDATFDAMLSGNPFALAKATSDTPSPPSQGRAVHELLTEDLGLEALCSAMAEGDPFIHETARRALLSGLTAPEAIDYRQAVVADALRNPGAVRDLHALAVRAIEHERNPGTIFRPTEDPESLLAWSVKVLELEVGVLEELRAVADAEAQRFHSEGFRRFFAMIASDLDDGYLELLRLQLRELRFDGGILASARLGRGDASCDWVIHRTPGSSWRQRFGLGSRTPAHAFDVSPADAPGQRALSALRARALGDVAAAAAQAVGGVKDFFTMLRLELSFLVGCLNLHSRLTSGGHPLCMPEAVAPGGHHLAAHDLRDVALALASGSCVVGNDLEADGAALVVITGANQGGKSSLLRAIGMAQLMMGAGMFVCARSFRASVAAGVLTHFTRGEDTSLRGGKLDEELQRMSHLVDHATSDTLLLCNESFASTNEREGSEIGRHVISAMLDSDITVVLVTHLYELAEHLRADQHHRSRFLRTEPHPDGTPSFRMVPGLPQPDHQEALAWRGILSTGSPPS
ncbi:MutS-related protein [Tessaracoccus antarcticus]|uniref:DNA mismatch repair protein MutS n=1 Tax=Tessaracoccus antarcticus TaxID=2479848 RepID=A0A3M0GBC4_9ACTN|nr:DNA mismatch repair protein MutS [Tessaracoccus antarcticus]RMB61657.1 DNA mismatch repair protein MutS [Tessaracoccus antarcticus]